MILSSDHGGEMPGDRPGDRTYYDRKWDFGHGHWNSPNATFATNQPDAPALNGRSICAWVISLLTGGTP